jgi:YD repeat-containing protein
MFGVPVERLLHWTTALFLVSLALTTLCGVAFWRLSVLVTNEKEGRLAQVRDEAAARVALVRDEQERLREKASRQAADAEARALAAAEEARAASERAREAAARAEAATANARAANDKNSDAQIRAQVAEEQARTVEQRVNELQEKNRALLSAEQARQRIVADVNDKFAPRRLTDADARSLRTALAKVRSVVPEVSITRLGDMEAYLYASDLKAAFEAAGIRVVVNTIGQVTPPVYGVVVYEDQTNGVIAPSLAEAGIQARVEAPGNRSAPQIVVGLKPSPF